jgi:hypothetical protein
VQRHFPTNIDIEEDLDHPEVFAEPVAAVVLWALSPNKGTI